MTNWQITFARTPPKAKAELREILTEAVRNTQPEPKRPPKPKGQPVIGAAERNVDEA
jgi:hypothetical protein